MPSLSSLVSLFLVIVQMTTTRAEYPVVAFTSSLSQNLANLAPSTVIPFDNIVTNVGNGYNSATGKFKAPYKGLYQFSMTILGNAGGRTAVHVVLNGTVKAWLWAAGPDYGSASTTLFLELLPGDEVWGQIFEKYGDFVHWGYSSFSGILHQRL